MHVQTDIAVISSEVRETAGKSSYWQILTSTSRESANPHKQHFSHFAPRLDLMHFENHVQGIMGTHSKRRDIVNMQLYPLAFWKTRHLFLLGGGAPTPKEGGTQHPLLLRSFLLEGLTTS